jgi:hypothetical protein
MIYFNIAKSKCMRFVVPADLDLLKIFKLNVTDIYHSGYMCDPKLVDKTKLTKQYINQLFRGKHPCG